MSRFLGRVNSIGICSYYDEGKRSAEALIYDHLSLRMPDIYLAGEELDRISVVSLKDGLKVKIYYSWRMI
mgnify:CR=1 FL=1